MVPAPAPAVWPVGMEGMVDARGRGRLWRDGRQFSHQPRAATEAKGEASSARPAGVLVLPLLPLLLLLLLVVQLMLLELLVLVLVLVLVVLLLALLPAHRHEVRAAVASAAAVRRTGHAAHLVDHARARKVPAWVWEEEGQEGEGQEEVGCERRLTGQSL